MQSEHLKEQSPDPEAATVDAKIRIVHPENAERPQIPIIHNSVTERARRTIVLSPEQMEEAAERLEPEQKELLLNPDITRVASAETSPIPREGIPHHALHLGHFVPLTSGHGRQQHGGEADIFLYRNCKGKPGNIAKRIRHPEEFDLHRQRTRYRRLRDFFSSHPGMLHIPPTHFIQRPIEGDVIVQQAIDPVFRHRHVRLSSGYLELQENADDPDLFEYINRHLVSLDHPGHFDRDAFTDDLPLPDRLRELIGVMEKDRSAKDFLRKFLELAVEFSVKYDELLDVMGLDNYALAKTPKGWAMHSVDPLHANENLRPLAEKLLTSPQEWRYVRKDENREQNSHSYTEAGILLNPINAARTINGLLALTGSDKRWDIFHNAVRATGGSLVQRCRETVRTLLRGAPETVPVGFAHVHRQLRRHYTEIKEESRISNDNGKAHASANTADDNPPPDKTVLKA